MRARRALVALLVVVAAGEASVRAGVQDTPLPTFSDGQAAQLAALIPGAIKDNNVETVVICTNLTLAPLDVGLEVFDETGALRNSIAAGDGASTPDTCTAGGCFGVPLVGGADRPCDRVAACDPGTGQCAATAPVSTCVPGGGKPATDCAAEWVVENPSNPKGRNSGVQLCKQGDGSCDFDIDPRLCTFHVRVCLNSHDLNLGSCQPDQLSTYELKSPGTRSANGRALLDAVAALAPSSRSAKRPSRIVFGPPDATPDHCTPAVPVRVPLARPLVVKVSVGSPTGTRDKDRLRLKCVRKLGGR